MDTPNTCSECLKPAAPLPYKLHWCVWWFKIIVHTAINNLFTSCCSKPLGLTFLWNGKLDILKWRHIWPIFSQVVGTGDFQLENNIHKNAIFQTFGSHTMDYFHRFIKKYIIYICNALSLKQKIFKGNIKQFNAAAQSCSHAFYLHRFFFTLLFLYGPLEHVTHLFVSLHWLLVAARIKFNTLMLAYRTATGSASSYLHSLMTIYIPPEAWDLRVSDASWCHHREAQNHVPERFHSPFLAGGMTFHPYPECWVPDNFQATPENSSLPSSLDNYFLKKKKYTLLSFLNLSLSS